MTEASVCPSCGEAVASGTAFCQNCGRSLAPGSDQPQPLDAEAIARGRAKLDALIAARPLQRVRPPEGERVFLVAATLPFSDVFALTGKFIFASAIWGLALWILWFAIAGAVRA